LGPDENIVREPDDLEPHRVERELIERELVKAGVLVVADAVLDVGVQLRWRRSIVAISSPRWSVRIIWKR